jgi:transposase
MGCEPDDWAREWVEKKRSEGEKGLTVEKRGNFHIVKWATTRWDAETKKRRKISEYRGVLDPDGTLKDPRPMRSRIDVTDVRDSGNARLLVKVAEKIIDSLKRSFPFDHPEIIELVFARILGRGELNKCGRCWNRLEDVLGLRPNTSPKSLSHTLEKVGLGRGSQDIFFSDMRTEDPEMAVDMSVIFSRARGAFLSKRGYNRFNLTYPQFNLLLVCGLASGRPQYMKVLPGNAKEGSAVCMLDEFSIPEGTLLVGDRGYNDKKFLKAVRERGLDYLVAVKRNSKAYELTDTKEGVQCRRV